VNWIQLAHYRNPWLPHMNKSLDVTKLVRLVHQLKDQPVERDHVQWNL